MKTWRHRVGPVAVVLALVASAAASAQTSAVSQAGGANGIKVGEGRVHPYFDLELRFDSAAISSDSQIFPDLLAHFRPGLRMEVPGSTVYLQLNGNVDYVWYTGLLTQAATNASHLEGTVNLDLAFNQAGAVEFRIGDQFARTDRTQNPAVNVGVVSLFNEARVSLPIHPGGHALEVTPGASFTVEFFDPLITSSTPGNNPSVFNYTQLGFQLGARYKFLPKTALVLDSDFLIPTYQSGGGEMLLHASAGLSGLISQKIAVVAKLGWGHSFVTPSARTLIAQAELSYLASQTASVKLGYLRTLQPVANFNVFRDDRGYLEARALMGGRLTLRGYGAFDLITYEGGASAGTSDTNLRIDLGPEYQFTPWFIGGAGYVLSVRGTGRTNAIPYTRHEGYVRLTLTY